MDKKQAQDYIKEVLQFAFNANKFETFVRNILNDFEPRDNSYAGTTLWESFRDHIAQYKRIGKYIDSNGESMDILVIETKTISKLDKARTTLRNFVVKHLLTFEKDYALAAFYSKEDNGADWRFSFVKIDREEQRTPENRIRIRKEITPARRYSYLVGEHENTYTAQKQLLPLLVNDYSNPSLEELEKAFSIEKVTTEFFEQYKELYHKLSENEPLKKALEKQNLDPIRFTKKLLGQIVFLYFIQKKGWLGVPKNESWGKGERRFLHKLFVDAKTTGQNFFKHYLQYLFYQALAKPRSGSPDPAYYKRFDSKIPFLNGGLFEADYDWEQVDISIPNELFQNDEKNKAGDKGTGILDVFDRYNFTIKEDEPLEKEVAIDPEMLGKVFENMLEIKERKSKGAYYTPREIVHYMCQESLINYLDRSLNSPSAKKGNAKGRANRAGSEEIIPREDIEVLIQRGYLVIENDLHVVNKGRETETYSFKLPETIRQHSRILDKKLADIKICDPAIGSGAFPVGLLHEIVTARLILNTFIQNKENTSYHLKRHAIQESIYGVDSEASATDIARLRLWLSLVVDEDDFYQIEALPNLDYKIVTGNSLIGLPETAMRDLKVQEEIEELKSQFFNTTEETEKKTLRNEINIRIRRLLDSAEQFSGYKIDFDFRLFFSEVWHYNDGFDIVIGNPPYGATFKQDEKQILRELFPSIKGQPESYEYFLYESVNSIGNDHVCLAFIVPTNFIESKRAEGLRSFFLNNGLINTISNFRYNVWRENAAETLIFIYEKNLKGKTRILYPKTPQEFEKREGYVSLEQSAWLNTPGKRFIIRSDSNLLKVIEEDTLQLGQITEISQGIIVYQTREESIENKFISSKARDGWVKLLDTKSHITKYHIHWGGNYLKYGEWLCRPREERFFNQSKLVFIRLRNRSLSRKLIAAFDDQSYYNRDNFNDIIQKDLAFDLRYILAVFNSDVINYWYKSIFDNVNINPEQVKLIPVRKSDFQGEIVTLVKYCELLATVDMPLEFSFFSELVEGCVYEIYFASQVFEANKPIIEHLRGIRQLDSHKTKEGKLAAIKGEFARLYDPNHPVRNSLETLDSIDSIRMIKDAFR